jgi:hypothetical protein
MTNDKLYKMRHLILDSGYKAVVRKILRDNPIAVVEGLLIP